MVVTGRKLPPEVVRGARKSWPTISDVCPATASNLEPFVSKHRSLMSVLYCTSKKDFDQSAFAGNNLPTFALELGAARGGSHVTSIS